MSKIKNWIMPGFTGLNLTKLLLITKINLKGNICLNIPNTLYYFYLFYL
jgi:hypothetical protein